MQCTFDDLAEYTCGGHGAWMFVNMGAGEGGMIKGGS